MSTHSSRRRFVTTAAVASASVWIPRPVSGYSPAEIRAATVDGVVMTGVSKWDLDTPALCVDLDKMEQNIATCRRR